MNVVLAAAQESNGSLIFWGLVGLVGVGYIASLFLHPYTHCRRCNGSPRQFGSIYTKSWRNCGKCGGSGREIRRGRRILRIDK